MRSWLIRYATDCLSYECFIPRETRPSYKLLGQENIIERLKLSLRKLHGQYGDIIKHYEVSLSQILHDIPWHCHIHVSETLNCSGISLTRDFVTELDIITDVDLIIKFREASTAQFQMMQLASRGRLLIHSPCPVPFGTCICSDAETSFSWTCYVSGLFAPQYFCLTKVTELYKVFYISTQ